MEVNEIQGKTKKTNIRWLIVVTLFLATTINFADRATISLAGPALSKDMHLDHVALGYIFSAFGWAYMIGQVPGGWLLDRFGSKKVYACSLFFWSLFTVLQGGVSYFSIPTAVIVLFGLRCLVGIAEAPALPGNSRITAAWFPTSERGRAVSIFNSAQYFATAFFAPIMGWIIYSFGWQHVFVLMGSIGIVFAFIWTKVIYNPREHPYINKAELDYIASGGGLVDMDQKNEKSKVTLPVWWCVKQLFKNRMMVGTYIGQYCISTLTYFFLTWFPVYLVQARGMSILKAGFVASLPALCGFLGSNFGGMLSDYLLKKGYSLSVARKTPIVLGMLLSVSLIICNYVNIDWLIVVIMSLAFFGKGVGAFGWAVISDTSPKEIAGLNGGIFNMVGNISAIVSPIAIGYIIQGTGSFNGALVFVGAHAIGAIFSYLVIVGKIERMKLSQELLE